MNRTFLLTAVLALLFTSETKAITTFNVTNTNDAGAGSLRQAIIDANATANSGGNDIIDFSGLGAGTHTITLASDLPSPTEGVTIDGYTATSYASNSPVIGIDGFTHGFLINNAGATGSFVRGIVIWGCTQDGIEINGVTNITIRGCWIGLDLTGAVPGAIINDNGIYITNASSNIKIGSSSPVDRNIISGCADEGIFIDGGSTDCIIQNNYIGTGTGGNTDLGNGQRGIRVDASNDNQIGVTSNGNVISGNGNHGILVSSSTGTEIINNYIGPGADGSTDLGNDGHGINLDNADNTTIGGSTSNDRNVISGNGAGGLGIGITVTNTSDNCIIRANYIGTNSAGTAALTNAIHGINIENSVDTQIGGTGADEGNLISGNTFSGINIDNASHRTIIRGNYIGVNFDGSTGIANNAHGIYISASDNCEIGGSTLNERNIISDNGDAAGENGISITNCNGHTIMGNFVGVTATGLAALANNDSGLSITTSTGVTVGGSNALEKNVFSGNNNFGIFLDNVDNSDFTNNYIGCDSTGNTAIANGTHGIQAQNDCSTNTWSDNFVNGNTQVGFNMLDIDNNTFTGNYIGLARNGSSDLGNGTIGLRFGAGSSNNTVGGSTSSDRNYISGNGTAAGHHGFFADGASTNTTFIGNYVGSDTSGTIAVGNGGIGIFFLDGSSNNTIGTTNSGEGNLVCCSLNEDGIRSQVSTNTDIQNNIIGLDINMNQTAGFGNALNGIWLMTYGGQTVNDCNIGGLGANERNHISQNGLHGVRVSNYGGTINFETIIGNKIYCNGGEAIDLESGSENESVVAPVVTTTDANTISGTGTAGNTVHVYYNFTGDGGGDCNCEGEAYRGTAVVDGGGNWSVTHNMGYSAAQQNALTATQTTPSGSTSEMWVCSDPLPVTYGNIAATSHLEYSSIEWVTTSEENNSHFIIQKSYDGNMFFDIGSVAGNGNSAEAISYQFNDHQYERDQLVFYRIVQVDFDGKNNTSKIVVLTPGHESLLQVVHKTQSSLLITSAGNDKTWIKVYSVDGKIIESQSTSNPTTLFSYDYLSPGVYLVHVQHGNELQTIKVIR